MRKFQLLFPNPDAMAGNPKGDSDLHGSDVNLGLNLFFFKLKAPALKYSHACLPKPTSRNFEPNNDTHIRFLLRCSHILKGSKHLSPFHVYDCPSAAHGLQISLNPLAQPFLDNPPPAIVIKWTLNSEVGAAARKIKEIPKGNVERL